MIIEQFEDKGLAQYSYVVMSEGEAAVIDPARDPKPYCQFAMLHDACIKAVVETHAHADFVSSHREIGHTKEARVYTSRQAGAAYEHLPFDEGSFFRIGELTLHALNTPGHSRDSICVLVKDADQRPRALFTGDTLFVGDVGRPDLHDRGGAQHATREAMARDLYRSLREKIMTLPDEVLVYPGHGAGSLCGKSLGSAPSSTIGAEKQHNPALQPMSEAEFVSWLLADQPFVPAYFSYTVELNRHGPPVLKECLLQVPHLAPDCHFNPAALVVDTRPAAAFRQGHLPRAINLQDGPKFETWLGALVLPQEKFYLLAEDEDALNQVIAKTARIGYETHIKGAVVDPQQQTETAAELDLAAFRAQPQAYTVVDVRNPEEVKDQAVFAHSLHLPLPELRHRLAEVPRDKPIVVHCASGYRSAAASSILAAAIKEQPVYDLGEAIAGFIDH